MLQAVLDGGATTTECRQVDSDCIYIAKDVDDDGSIDALLCNVDRGNAPACQLWDHAGGQWRPVARFTWYQSGQPGRDAILEKLRAGNIMVVPRRWPNLQVGGQIANPQ